MDDQCLRRYVSVVITLLVLISLCQAGSIVSFYAEEEVEGDQLLGNIIHEVNSTNLNGWNFDIEPSTYNHLFSISQNSSFFLNIRVDREALCSSRDVCKITLTIIAYLDQYYEPLTAEVYISDINDHQPTFTPTVHNLDIPEGTSIGTSYGLPSAHDPDTGNNTIQSYSLLPENSKFTLEAFRNLDRTYALNLVLNLSLDRETQESYELTILAIDGGANPQTGTLTVSINVTDINDNKPVFNPQTYNVTINENMSVGSEIVTVTATDRDIGDNQRLTYSITKMEPASISNLIGIDSESGRIYLAESLETETGLFTLYVEARDHGEPVKKSFQAQVKIYIKDINNNKPVISVNTLNGGKPYAKVKENSDNGTLVALVNVRDADTGLNGQAVCVCENNNFAIANGSTNTFSIHVAAPINREEIDSYNISISCTDGGIPSLSSSETFLVEVEDENDHTPTFSSNTYERNITENNKVDEVLLQVEAVDLDAGDNAKIKYVIQPFNGSDKFHIDATNGTIRATVSLDREVKQRYTFFVKASDSGTPALFDIATIVIKIEDLNDNPPKFIGDSYAMSVLENAAVNTTIGIIQSTDPDLGLNGQVLYTIPQKFAHYPFEILDDGAVVLADELDRETVASYQFNAVASDFGDPVMSSSIPIVVTILDVNDNAPFIEFPNDDNDTVSVPHNALLNVPIAFVEANDADSELNQLLTYNILAGNDAELFSINTGNGSLYITRQVPDGEIKQFTLTISVNDNGVNPLETITTLHVSIYKAKTDPDTLELGGNGRNILIVILITCVTFVLSVIIIIAIILLRHNDRKNRLYSAKAYDEQKMIRSGTGARDSNQSSNRSSSSRNSRDKIFPPIETRYSVYSPTNSDGSAVGDQQDGEIYRQVGGEQYDVMSTFKSSRPMKTMEPYRQDKHSPHHEAQSTKHEDILRISSLRVQQAITQTNSNNSNNNNSNNISSNKISNSSNNVNRMSNTILPASKLGRQTADECLGRGYYGLEARKEDTQSESSEEVTASDSGRGGSDDDLALSRETEEPHSLSVSSSHPLHSPDSEPMSTFRGPRSNLKMPNYLTSKSPPIQDHRQRYSMTNLNHEHIVPRGSYDALSDSVPRGSYNALSDSVPRDSYDTLYDDVPRDSYDALNEAVPRVSYDALSEGVTISKFSDNGRVIEPGIRYDDSLANMSHDDDDNTTTSGSFTIPEDLHDDSISSNHHHSQSFYKPDTFV